MLMIKFEVMRRRVNTNETFAGDDPTSPKVPKFVEQT